MMRNITLLFIVFLSIFTQGQITIVQTLTFDSTGRDYSFQFPQDDGTNYEKIIMEYSMRCKGGNISTQGAPNDIGCGEWDYSCNTFIVDSSQTDSIKAMHDSYDITGFSGNDYPFVNQATYTYTQYEQYNVNYTNIISETEATIGNGTDLISHPFRTDIVSKVQYLYTATELSAAGLQAGNITGLKLDVNTAGDDANFLRIRIKQTSQNELNISQPKTDNFTEVYFNNTHFSTGINQLNFYNNFSWDGTSNLIVEFSYTNNKQSIATKLNGYNTNNNYALLSIDGDYFMEFSDLGNVDISNSDYSSLNNEISVQFWAYGNTNILPYKTSVFEARDSQNKRQINSHLPWNDANIYWDCGNNGSYDRIYHSATTNEYKGKWHHWTFTKNANTGKMKIYLDGNIWLSGTGKTKQIVDIKNFNFGSNVAGTHPYFGYIDDFSVWNKELSQSEIQAYMYKEIDNSHPQYNNLINYFNLNEGSDEIITDLSPNNVNGIYNGIAKWKKFRGKDIFKNFTIDTYRPNITFIEGTYDINIDTLLVIDSVENIQNKVISYQVNGTDLEIVDTNYYYQAGNMFIYNEQGVILDTIFVAAIDTLHITELSYYKKYPSIFEIMSFVTPYGLYLDLGSDGKTWQFDVTDFAPILKGNKRMYLTGGTHQEDLDIKFIFVEGTPPRNVIDIKQIWRAGTQRSYSNIMNNRYFEPRDIKLDSTASMFKIRTAITGHGQQGEFISRTHYINLNGGSNEFQWQVWKECADNPVYPQGGTWTYDRAGWCPGAPTDLQEFEITDLVVQQDTVNIDYGVTSGSGDSKYVVNCQLVSYSNPNFTNDVSIVEIKKPSNRIEFARENPVCYAPTVVIRNTGSANLTSCKITYEVSGGETKEFNWTGNLSFNETEEVELPIQQASFWVGDGSHIFTTIVSKPNGVTDEYAANNTQTSKYVLPDIYDDKLYLYLKTNNHAYQNSYVIKDVEGNLVFSKYGLQNNTYYYDTLNLEDGCYTIEMTDSGNDGLQYWANSAQGTGSFRLKSATSWTTYKIFEPDFGKLFNYSFVLGNITYIKDEPIAETNINVFPNPTNDIVNIVIKTEKNTDIKIDIYNLTGKKIISQRFDNSKELSTQIDLSNTKSGFYICKIKTKEKTFVKKISVL